MTKDELLKRTTEAIQGLIVLLKCMTIEERDYYIKNNIKWFETGHGQFAMKVLKELENYSKGNN